MPTYDYLCGACGHEYELFQSITANPKRKCPDCGRLKAKRLIGTGGGVIFKGSGFYETDYRSDSYRNAAKADKASASSSSSSSTDSSKDSKAAKVSDAPKKSSDASKSDGGKNGDK